MTVHASRGNLKPGFCLPIPNTEMPQAEPQTLKTCPRCAEQVKADAQVCRFCGKKFVAPLSAGTLDRFRAKLEAGQRLESYESDVVQRELERLREEGDDDNAALAREIFDADVGLITGTPGQPDTLRARAVQAHRQSAQARNDVAARRLREVRDMGGPTDTTVHVAINGSVEARCSYRSAFDKARHAARMHKAGWTISWERRPTNWRERTWPPEVHWRLLPDQERRSVEHVAATSRARAEAAQAWPRRVLLSGVALIIVIVAIVGANSGGGDTMKWHTSCAPNPDGSVQVTVTLDSLASDAAAASIKPYAILEGGEKSYGSSQLVDSTGTYSYEAPVPPDATAISCGADVS